MRTTELQIGISLVLLMSGPAFVRSAEVTFLNPSYKAERVLVASDPGQASGYLAFPDVLDLGSEILVSFKRGKSHAADPGAVLDLIRIGKTTRQVSQPETLAGLDGKIMQMGEWVQFPNGDIVNYIDVQQVANSTRVGLHSVRSTDGGRTFGPVERVGVVDGVEYGYAFDSVTQGTTTWMLAMTFSNLPGGKSVYPPRPHAGPVDVIRSDDNGRTWQFVQNLSREFGNVPINESAFVVHQQRFIVTTRGYDDHQRVHLTNADFQVQKQLDYTSLYHMITKHIGRPRLFVRDDRVYLLGRNYTKSPGPMQLCLFRLDPSSLAMLTCAVLDNAEGANVTDGYYAVPYFLEEREMTLMCVVTYKGLNARPPQIVELQYQWDELR